MRGQRIVHLMVNCCVTVLKLPPKFITFGGSLYLKVVQTTISFCLKREYTLNVDVEEQRGGWSRQDFLGVGIFTSRITPGQFSYLLFASLKSVKSCPCEINSNGIVLSSISIPHYQKNGFFLMCCITRGPWQDRCRRKLCCS